MYELKIVTHESTATLKKSWDTQLHEISENTEIEVGYLLSAYERIYDWCEKHCNDEIEHSPYFLINGDGEIHAIAEIVKAEKSKDPATKLLNIYVEPSLNPEWWSDEDENELNRAINVLANVFVQSSVLSSDSGLKKLKIFCRTSQMENMFDALVSDPELQESKEISLYREGKWLIIVMREC